MTKIIIDTDTFPSLVEKGGQLVFKKEAEESIVSLMSLIEQLEQELEKIKKQIAQAGESINPDFRGVIGKQINAIFTTREIKYSYDIEFLEILKEQGFIETKTKYKVDRKKIDKYFDLKRTLPEGISLNKREKKLILYKKNEKDQALLQSTESLDEK